MSYNASRINEPPFISTLDSFKFSFIETVNRERFISIYDEEKIYTNDVGSNFHGYGKLQVTAFSKYPRIRHKAATTPERPDVIEL